MPDEIWLDHDTVLHDSYDMPMPGTSHWVRAEHDAQRRKELAEIRSIVHQFANGQQAALVALGLIGNVVLRGEAP